MVWSDASRDRARRARRPRRRRARELARGRGVERGLVERARTARMEVSLKRSDVPRRRRREIVAAIKTTLSDPSIGARGDSGTLKRIAESVSSRIRDAATHVVVGRSEFSANLRFAKGTLAYATARATSKGPTLRILVFDSLTLGSGASGSEQLAFQAMREENDEAPAARRKGGATCVSGSEGLPNAVVNTALSALNDTSLDDDDDEARASGLRDALTKKFGSFWYVISDDSDFAVACRASELPAQHSDDEGLVRVVMRFVRGKTTYEVWHHIAPFDRFGLTKMTWSEKAKYARYGMIFVGGLATMWYRSKCTESPDALACQILPKTVPFMLGLFIFFVVTAHVDTAAWKKLGKEV